MSETTNQEGFFSFTQPVTMSFPNLLEAKAVMKGGKPTGEPKFSSSFEFDPADPDLAAAKALAAQVAKAKWPGRALSELSFPFANGDKLAEKAAAKGKDRDFSKGKVVLTARSKYQPRLSMLENGKVVDLEGEAALKLHGRRVFYNGVQALAQVNFVAYEGVGNNPDGVTAYLNLVMSLGTGTKLSGGASAAEVFKGYVGTTSNEDPTAGISGDDEEIPF